MEFPDSSVHLALLEQNGVLTGWARVASAMRQVPLERAMASLQKSKSLRQTGNLRCAVLLVL